MSAGNVKRERIQHIKEEAHQRGETLDEAAIAEMLPEQEVTDSVLETPLALRVHSVLDLDTIGLRDDGTEAGRRGHPVTVQFTIGRVPRSCLWQGAHETVSIWKAWCFWVFESFSATRDCTSTRIVLSRHIEGHIECLLKETMLHLGTFRVD